MRNEVILIGREITVFLFASLFITFMLVPLYMDVVWMDNALHEASFTETTQELLLVSLAGAFYIAARHRPDQCGGLTLIAGFYSCMLIRELDFFFDLVRHGSWVWFALATALASFAVAMRTPRQTLRTLANLLHHNRWPVMATGLMIVLVFSRLFGMNTLWQHLMPDHYNRGVKNMAEEGIELLGYSLCWLAGLRYLWQTRP
ncbi:hypothetical protein [Pantoea stewartii]|uniref:Transporter n=1 Tax=Pantoea stewartii subsp. stewartii DC283 TaxID=660596 RepID=H3RIL4_PANSE|nr:hypothetical protein [Pantoea stewartii]ARF47937.1 hypothetical protein DSJ_00105 [Pantoea stewartii subsp. stewartii DC283]EHT98722.1 hypothetical protein CKS_4325 [Pantoea stewartii subsp. stewartii DC283]KAB0558760.1 hypothetical protein F7Q90_04335 [Pantoea stewartii subsp. stewartii]